MKKSTVVLRESYFVTLSKLLLLWALSRGKVFEVVGAV